MLLPMGVLSKLLSLRVCLNIAQEAALSDAHQRHVVCFQAANSKLSTDQSSGLATLNRSDTEAPVAVK